MKLLSQGQTNPQIAQNLLFSVSTVKAQVRSILSKLGVSDRTQAAVRAIESRLTVSSIRIECYFRRNRTLKKSNKTRKTARAGTANTTPARPASSPPAITAKVPGWGACGGPGPGCGGQEVAFELLDQDVGHDRQDGGGRRGLEVGRSEDEGHYDSGYTSQGGAEVGDDRRDRDPRREGWRSARRGDIAPQRPGHPGS